MRARTSLTIVAVGLACTLVAFSACTTDYQQGKDDVVYGGPNALANKTPPGTSLQNDPDAGGGSSSGGLTCGTQVDGGPCAVSWSKDIVTAWDKTANCSLTACHGGATPPNPPSVDTKNASTTWTTLQGFTITTGLPYINPCSTDPATSAIARNVLADPGATGGSHMPQAGQLEQKDVDNINTWVKCGAPNN